MAKPSPFFARIKRDVLAILMQVPQGRLITFADAGAHIDVPARHVAYILSQLDHAESVAVPWFRAIPEDGCLKKSKRDALGADQRELLQAEGHLIAPDGRIMDVAQNLVLVADLPHGVHRQKRPEDAPRANASRTTVKAGTQSNQARTQTGGRH